jgi:hypothetical protein
LSPQDWPHHFFKVQFFRRERTRKGVRNRKAIFAETVSDTFSPRESPTAPFDGQFEMAILYQELPVVVADLTYPNQEFSTWGQLVRGYGRQLTPCSYESNFLSDHESNHLWSSAIQNACRIASQYRKRKGIGGQIAI